MGETDGTAPSAEKKIRRPTSFTSVVGKTIKTLQLMQSPANTMDPDHIELSFTDGSCFILEIWKQPCKFTYEFQNDETADLKGGRLIPRRAEGIEIKESSNEHETE